MHAQAMGQLPHISVVMPTFNQARFLPEALESVFNQICSSFELIVIDDGSTDQTPEILQQYRARFPFTVIRQENQKLPRALNAGFRVARGDYLTWTSSDNVMLPQMLQVLGETLDQHLNVGLVYADWELIDEQSRSVGVVRTLDFDPYLLMRVNYINACFMYRRLCQTTVGLYDADYLYAEDWEYWFRISRFYRMLRVPCVLYRYRIHSDSLTATQVMSRGDGRTSGYQKLAMSFRRQRLGWYLSKLKWEALRLKLGRDPQVALSRGAGR